MRFSHCVLLLAGLLLADTDAAATAATAPVRLETTVVSGEQPGPGLWRVSAGEHVLWILGTQSPMPKRMVWRSRDVEALVAGSQAVLGDASVAVSADIGTVRLLLMVPKILAARENPDHQTLAEVLPAELYARWLPLKQRYIGRSRKIERWRPLFAANRLYARAIRKSGLTDSNRVWPLVEKAAKRHRVPVIEPELKITLEHTKQTLNDFARASLDDRACFERTLDRLESDLEAMRARANAWAVGDLERLQSLPFADNHAACRDAVLNAELIQQRGLEDLPARRIDLWMEAAETALGNNRSTVAVVSLDVLLRPGGYLERLQARGYSVEAPE